MALHELLSMIPHEVVDTRRPVVARWTETPVSGTWDPEPAYGAFVDEDVRVVSGNRPARAFLESDDPRHLQLAQGVEWALTGAGVYFLDWGRQPLAWEEIFDLWDAWDSQGMIADCGTVAVAWSLAGRWIAPGWVAFRDGFDGAPLAVTERGVPAAETVSQPASSSFLARALKLRGEEQPAVSTAGVLPMLPFTLESLHDPHHPWPVGVGSGQP
jgi:hypothetical protein